MDVAETDWAVYVLVLTAFLLFSLGLLYRNVDECPLQEEEAQFPTVREYVEDKFRNMREIVCDPKKVMVLCEFTLIAALYYNILLWFPYYFTVSGY